MKTTYTSHEVKEITLRYQQRIDRLVYRATIMLLVAVLAACTIGIVIGDLFLNARVKIVETVITEKEIVMVPHDGPTMFYEELALPARANGSFKTYMDYRAIKSTTSKQYALQRLAYTDPQGFRKFNGYYLVAMGSFYTRMVGERFRITLESGRQIYVMIGDLKSDAHTNPTHQFMEANGNIVEFIMDVEKMDEKVKSSGSVSKLDLQGAIVKIERIS